MVRSVTSKAKNAITDVAQRGVENVRSVASDAGTAAKAAADAVLELTSSALQAGRARVKQGHAGDEAGDRNDAPTEEKKVAKRKVPRKKTASRRKTKRRARR